MATRSIDKLLKSAQTKIKSALKKEIVPYAINTEIDMIYEYVYGVYDPVRYERREDDGGLAAVKNFRTRDVGGGMKYEIVNVTRGKNNRSVDVASLVYGGDGYMGMQYDYPSMEKRDANRYRYLLARDYITPTIDELERKAATVLKSSLEHSGLRVR